MKLILTSFLALFALSTSLSAQSSIKIFDATPIMSSGSMALLSSSPYRGTFRTAQVNLSCPPGRRPKTTLSGPFGGQFVVDNMIILNDNAVCGRGTSCFSSLYSDPGYSIGLPIELAYAGVDPVDLSGEIRSSGLYTFYLLDFGYALGNTEIYLNTTCTLANGDGIPITEEPPPTSGGEIGETVICHHDNGNRLIQTLRVGPSSIDPHLSHGDTLGACK